MGSFTFQSCCLLTAATLLTACSQAETPVRGARAESLAVTCIDRLLLSAPAPLEFAASDAKYGGTHSFPGIDDLGARGVRFADNKLTESHITSDKEFREIEADVRNTLTTPTQFASHAAEIRDNMEFWKELSKSGDAELRARVPEKLETLRAELAASKAARSDVGAINIRDKAAFAFRDRRSFKFGFYAFDKRVRIWEGEIPENLKSSYAEVEAQYLSLRSRYVVRAASEVPSDRGFCTPHGIILDAVGEAPERNTRTDVMFRSVKYPNLIFRITVEPATTNGKDIHTEPNLGADRANLHLVGIEKRYGPERVSILGANGSVLGYSYGQNCSKTSCRPADQLYEFEAKTYGKAGSEYRPYLTLHMIAATSDEYKSGWPELPDAPDHNKVMRPGLKGKVPPPYEEGKRIFLQVLQSLRSKDDPP